MKKQFVARSSPQHETTPVHHFFIDRCLCCGIIISTLKGAGLTIEVHHDHFDDNAQDVVWLPEVGKREWVVLTKDSNIIKSKNL
ncbi:hypothetical protein LC593_16065 [Nostoc sp. CHAB 5844]|nr:hypothetical protein [Nostoc sp. CHAB 5844]